MNRILFSCTVALCLAATSAPASAFCRTTTCINGCNIDPTTGCTIGGAPLAWASACLSYSVHRDGSSSITHDQLEQTADHAFRAWGETTCPLVRKPPSITVNDVFGTAWCDRVEYNTRQGNANIVMMREPWEGERNLLALTTVSMNKETGQIYDVDMEINGSAPLSVGPPAVPGRYDLRSIMTHEVGHFLGLSHTNIAGSTMSANQMAGVDDFATLDTDDIAGICAIYPPERSEPACDPTPHLGFSPECSFDPVTGGCSLAVMRHRSSLGAMTAFLLGLCVAVGRLRNRRRA